MCVCMRARAVAYFDISYINVSNVYLSVCMCVCARAVAYYELSYINVRNVYL